MLLSRLANHLYWFGRYLERSEHTMRFIHVQHYSVMDSHSALHKMIFYRTVAGLYGVNKKADTLDDPLALQNTVLLNPDNPNSILSCVEFARANTMNIRNILSAETWEAVNRYAIFLRKPPPYIMSQGMHFDLIQRVTEYCALVRNLIDSTMLHDDAWAIIRFGIYLERALQINRITHSQISGIESLDSKEETARFQILISLLNSLQAKDTFYIARREIISVKSVTEFLVVNQRFPRSIMYNLQKSRQIYNHVFNSNGQDDGGYEINRISDMFRYIRPSQFENGLLPFLGETLGKLEEIAHIVEKDHLQA